MKKNAFGINYMDDELTSVYYKNHGSNKWLKARFGFFPRETDFKYMIFRIGNISYSKWSTDFEKMLVWFRLKNDTL